MFSRPSAPITPLDVAKKRIKAVTIIAYVAAAVSMAISVASAFFLKSAVPLILLPDAVLVTGLAYGIQKNSRICAALLVVYWIVARYYLGHAMSPSLIDLLGRLGRLDLFGLFGLLAILISFWLWTWFISGLVGTLNYHRYKAQLATMAKQRAPQLQQGVAAFPAKRRIHFFGMLTSLLMWLGLTCFILPPVITLRILEGLGWERLSSPDLLQITAMATFAYLINSFASPTLFSLFELNSVEDVASYIRRIKATPPAVGFTCECYHMETRIEYVTEYYTAYEQQYDATTNSHRSVAVSKSRQKQQTYEERVVTFRGHEDFGFSRWDDISVALPDDIYRHEATRVNFIFEIDLGNPRTEERYNFEKRQFIRKNEGRDKHFEFSEFSNLPNFQSHMLSIVDFRKRSRFYRWYFYVFLTLAGLSWPYRIWFDRQTVPAAFTFRKRIFI